MKRWNYYPSEPCPRCGGDLEIETSGPPLPDDAVRCMRERCGFWAELTIEGCGLVVGEERDR